MGVKCYVMVLICISVMNNDVEHLFIHLVAICIHYLEKCLFKYFYYFSLWSPYCGIVKEFFRYSVSRHFYICPCIYSCKRSLDFMYGFELFASFHFNWWLPFKHFLQSKYYDYEFFRLLFICKCLNFSFFWKHSFAGCINLG